MYEVNRLTNEQVIRGKLNFNANCLRHRTPNRPPNRTDSPIYKNQYFINQMKDCQSSLCNLLKLSIQKGEHPIITVKLNSYLSSRTRKQSYYVWLSCSLE